MGEAIMSADMETIVKVKIKRGPSGAWHARSDDMPGLHVLENTYSQLTDEIPRVIRDLLAAMGRNGDEVVQMVSGRNDTLKYLIRKPS